MHSGRSEAAVRRSIAARPAGYRLTSKQDTAGSMADSPPIRSMSQSLFRHALEPPVGQESRQETGDDTADRQ